MASAQNGFSNYVKLEERLVLLAWLNDLFGYHHNRDMLRSILSLPVRDAARAGRVCREAQRPETRR